LFAGVALFIPMLYVFLHPQSLSRVAGVFVIFFPENVVAGRNVTFWNPPPRAVPAAAGDGAPRVC
jgi:hypothetical protein